MAKRVSNMPTQRADDDIFQLVKALNPINHEARQNIDGQLVEPVAATGQSPFPSSDQLSPTTSTPSTNGSVLSERSLSEEGLSPNPSPKAITLERAPPAKQNMFDPVSLPRGVRLPQRKGGMQLWQFLYALLQEGYSDIIHYTDDESGLEFRISEPDAIAIWWGYQKNHRNMNFDKFSRSLRYYYERKLIQRVYGEKFVYRFCCHPEYLYEVLDTADSRPKLKPMPLAAKMALGQYKGKSTGAALPDWDDIKLEKKYSPVPSPHCQLSFQSNPHRHTTTMSATCAPPQSYYQTVPPHVQWTIPPSYPTLSFDCWAQTMPCLTVPGQLPYSAPMAYPPAAHSTHTTAVASSPVCSLQVPAVSSTPNTTSCIATSQPNPYCSPSYKPALSPCMSTSSSPAGICVDDTASVSPFPPTPLVSHSATSPQNITCATTTYPSNDFFF